MTLFLSIGIVLGAVALIWDFYAIHRWKHRDYTVSEFIYKFDHRYPIVAVAIGIILGVFFSPALIAICVGILVGHLLWKA